MFADWLQTGVSAITVHARWPHERPPNGAHWDWLKQLSQIGLKIPLIGNGDVLAREDIERMKRESGVDSVMIARGAIRNCSIFAQEQRDVLDVIRDYLRYAVSWGNGFQNTKYVITETLGEYPTLARSNWMNDTRSSKDIEGLCKVFGVQDHWQSFVEAHPNIESILTTKNDIAYSHPTKSILARAASIVAECGSCDDDHRDKRLRAEEAQ